MPDRAAGCGASGSALLVAAVLAAGCSGGADEPGAGPDSEVAEPAPDGAAAPDALDAREGGRDGTADAPDGTPPPDGGTDALDTGTDGADAGLEVAGDGAPSDAAGEVDGSSADGADGTGCPADVAGPTAEVATPEGLQKGTVELSYELVGPDCGSWGVEVAYSLDGGETFQPATPAAGGDGTAGLSASPEGTAHVFAWASVVDAGQTGSDIEVVLRVTPTPTGAAGETAPFTVRNTFHLEEVDEGALPTVEADVRDAASGDLDGDGDADVLLAVHGGANRLLLNDGTGSFTDASSERLPEAAAASTVAVALADLDGDGALDVLLGNQEEPSRVLLHDGSGTFVDATADWMPEGVNKQVEDLLVGDVTDDGRPDVYELNSGSEDDRLLVNDAWSELDDETSERLPPEDYPEVEGWMGSSGSMGDVDGDGATDIVWTSFLSGQTTRIYLNDGDGVFTDASDERFETAQETIAMDAELVDVDGDDAPEIYEANQNLSGPDVYYANDGEGHYEVAGGVPAETATASIDAVSADLNRDGHGDVFVASSTSNAPYNRNHLLLGDADGDLEAADAEVFEPASALSRGATTLDLEGDGDADVLVLNDGGAMRLLRNAE